LDSDRIQSFPFSADSRSEVLILGSMPGVESLRQQQYYAHPRNLFWDLMGEMFGATRERPYEERLKILRDNRIALWDVAHRCRRPGSLDSNISEVEANHFSVLFKTAPHIHTVFFNGKKADELFRRLVYSQMKQEILYFTLPSTSPANASISRPEKIRAWNQLKPEL
jgi:hypoxanthine-DNA glycosylase